jgi:2',3'-cyclic-nucleotide 2'-phosphodiesterase (5'-nucleotidase family)
VDVAVVNNGGLRIPVPAGPITVGQMYELMPFENTISVVTLTGVQIEALAQDIAARGGEPTAGFSFHILTEEERLVAIDIEVGGEPVDRLRRYRVATPNYLADGGDELWTLTAAEERVDLPVLVRDAFIAFVRERRIIEPVVEGRITGEVRR